MIISSSRYVSLVTGTEFLRPGLIGSLVFRVLPFKKSVHIWLNVTPTRLPVLFWVFTLLEFVPHQKWNGFRRSFSLWFILRNCRSNPVTPPFRALLTEAVVLLRRDGILF